MLQNIDPTTLPDGLMEEAYSSKNFLVRFVHNDRLRSIVELLPKQTPIEFKLLDAGCGEGHLLDKIFKNNPQIQLFGLDGANAAIAEAIKRCPFAFCKKGDLTKIDYPDNFFDVVTCTEVIEHITDFDKVLKELKRIIKPNGYIIITYPNETLWTISRFLLGKRPIKVPDHVNSFFPKKMIKSMNAKCIKTQSLPFKFLPFFLSLGAAQIFLKADNIHNY